MKIYSKYSPNEVFRLNFDNIFRRRRGDEKKLSDFPTTNRDVYIIGLAAKKYFLQTSVNERYLINDEKREIQINAETRIEISSSSMYRMA